MTTSESGDWHQHRKWAMPGGDVSQSDRLARLNTTHRWPSWLLTGVRTRQRPQPPARADELASITLPDHDGRPTRLSDLWLGGPAVIVWLRQFGCPFCRAQSVRLNASRERFEEAGAQLVLIGQGTPGDAAKFRSRFHIELPVLADQGRVSYAAAGAKLATFDELLGPLVVGKALLAMGRERVFIGHNTADEALLGGSLIVSRDGRVVWSHIAQDASDIAQPAENLSALRAVSPWLSSKYEQEGIA